MYLIDSGLVGSLGGVPREQKMLKGHLPRVIYHQVYQYTKMNHFFAYRFTGDQELLIHEFEILHFLIFFVMVFFITVYPSTLIPKPCTPNHKP